MRTTQLAAAAAAALLLVLLFRRKQMQRPSPNPNHPNFAGQRDVIARMIGLATEDVRQELVRLLRLPTSGTVGLVATGDGRLKVEVRLMDERGLVTEDTAWAYTDAPTLMAALDRSVPGWDDATKR